MLNKYIKTGHRVELSFKEDAAYRKKLVTAVEAVLDFNRVLVLMPMSGGTMVRLPIRNDYEARFYTNLSIMRYDCAVMEHTNVEGIYLTMIRLLSAGDKVQLRSFFRFTNSLTFRYSVLKEGEEFDEQPEMYEGLLVDLSAGGIRFVANEKLEVRTEIHAILILNGEYIMALGRILEQLESRHAAYKYQYRVQFLALPDMDREKIVRYINDQQYKSLRMR